MDQTNHTLKLKASRNQPMSGLKKTGYTTTSYTVIGKVN